MIAFGRTMSVCSACVPISISSRISLCALIVCVFFIPSSYQSFWADNNATKLSLFRGGGDYGKSACARDSFSPASLSISPYLPKKRCRHMENRRPCERLRRTASLAACTDIKQNLADIWPFFLAPSLKAYNISFASQKKRENTEFAHTKLHFTSREDCWFPHTKLGAVLNETAASSASFGLDEPAEQDPAILEGHVEFSAVECEDDDYNELRKYPEVVAYNERLKTKLAERATLLDSIEEISRSLPRHYEEAQMLIASGNEKALSYEEDYPQAALQNPYQWFTQYLSKYRMDSFTHRLSSQLNEFECNLKRNHSQKLSSPETEDELKDLSSLSEKPESYWKLSLLEQMYMHEDNKKLSSDFKAWAKCWRITEKFLLPVCCACGFGLSFVLTGCIGEVQRSSQICSHILGVVSGYLTSLRLHKSMKARFLNYLEKKTFGRWLLSEFKPDEDKESIELLRTQAIEELGIPKKDLAIYFEGIFKELFYGALTNLNYSNMWLSERDQLIRWKTLLRISPNKMLRILDEVVSKFITHYQVQRGLSYLDGMRWFFTRDPRRSFIDKLLYLSYFLLFNSGSGRDASASMYLNQLSNLVRVSGSLLKARLKNLICRGYRELATARLPLGCWPCKRWAKVDLSVFKNKLGISEEKAEEFSKKIFIQEVEWLMKTGLFLWEDDEKPLNRLHISESLRNRLSDFLDSLSLDENFGNEVLLPHTSATLKLKMHELIDQLRCMYITEAEFVEKTLRSLKDLWISHEAFIEIFEKVLKESSDSMKKTAMRYHKLNNRPMAVHTARQLLTIYRSLPKLAHTLQASEKVEVLSRFHRALQGESLLITSTMDESTAKELSVHLIEDKMKLGESWDEQDLRDWSSVTGIDYRELEEKRMDACRVLIQEDIFALLPSFYSLYPFENSKSLLELRRFADEVARDRREKVYPALCKKYTLDEKQLFAVGKLIYSNTLLIIANCEGIPQFEDLERLVKISALLGLNQEDVLPFHSLHFRNVYEKAVDEALSSSSEDGVLEESSKESLEKLRNFLQIRERDAYHISLYAMMNYLRTKQLPLIESALESLDLKDSSSSTESITEDSEKLLLLCCNLVKFYEGNRLMYRSSSKSEGASSVKLLKIEEDMGRQKDENAENEALRVSFSLRDILKSEAFQEEVVDRFLILTYSHKPGQRRQHLMEVVPKLGRIFGFSNEEFKRLTATLGEKVLTHFLQENLSKKNFLNADELSNIRMVQKEFKLEDSIVDKVVHQNKKKKLRALFDSLLENSDPSSSAVDEAKAETLTAGVQIVKASKELGIDILRSLNPSSQEIETLYRMEVSSLMLQLMGKEKEEMMKNFFALLSDFESSFGLSSEYSQKLLQDQSKESVLSEVSSSLSSMKADDYEGVVKHLYKAADWSYLMEDEEGVLSDLKLTIMKQFDESDIQGIMAIFLSQPFSNTEEQHDAKELLEKLFNTSSSILKPQTA